MTPDAIAKSTVKTNEKTAKKQVIFSGIQPSGKVMLGNYLGALKNWVKLQDNEDYDRLFCLVDLHAITVPQDPDQLREKTYEGFAIYLAAGIDPHRNTVFVQSHVPAHAELGWILTCGASMGELSRMTQFKDKSAKQKHIGAGLLAYPVLMAADILLYQTNLVPVGQDQKQHLELARDLAIRMNKHYGDLFAVPEPYIPPVGAKIMSLQDPTSKMSKSDEDLNATIFLADSDDVILKKLKRAVTDSGTEVSLSDDKPGIKNLLSIQSAITGKNLEEIAASYAGKQYGHLKIETAEIIISCLSPLRQSYLRYLEDKAELDRLLRVGAESAAMRAESTLHRVKNALGFIDKK